VFDFYYYKTIVNMIYKKREKCTSITRKRDREETLWKIILKWILKIKL